MKYKYKEILKAEVHFSGSQFSEQMRNELEEVYRKAESFDEIVKSFYEIRKDMKDEMVSYELGYQTIGTEVAKHIKQFNSKENPQRPTNTN